MQEETAEGLKRRAYSIGLKLKNSGLDAETIYARLEKQGIPEELAVQVVKDVMTERKKVVAREKKSFSKIAKVLFGLAVLAAVISAIILPGQILIPVGIIMSASIFAMASRT